MLCGFAVAAQSYQTFSVLGESFAMRFVEGGTFRMGSNDAKAYSDEKPSHQVTLSSYYIGVTEVTWELWEAVMNNYRCNSYSDSRKPIVKVSWNECQTFIQKLNEITGKKFRLPTEAEWEYAARGGKNSCGYKFAGGDKIEDVGWYHFNGGGEADYIKRLRSNELGLYDMSGNVWEWCSDWFGENYYSSSPSTNPQGPSSGTYRVVRGGSWSSRSGGCTVTSRNYCTPSKYSDDVGFRLAMDTN